MQKHAPTLRVCVYEGWKSLQKGIKRQNAVSSKARDNEKRKNERFRKETVNKYARLNGGHRQVIEQSSEPGYSEAEYHEDGESSNSSFGDRSESTLARTQRQFVAYVRAHDVVVTTYQ